MGQYRAYYYAEKAVEKSICFESVVHISVDPMGTVVKSADQIELEAGDKAIAGVLAGEGGQSFEYEPFVLGGSV